MLSAHSAKIVHFLYLCISVIFVCLCFCVRTVVSTMRILCKRVGRWFRRMTLTHSENLGWLIVAVIGNINMLLTILGGQMLAKAKSCHSSYHPQMPFVKRSCSAVKSDIPRHKTGQFCQICPNAFQNGLRDKEFDPSAVI